MTKIKIQSVVEAVLAAVSDPSFNNQRTMEVMLDSYISQAVEEKLRAHINSADI